jgi:hypothetical protein
MTSSPWPRRLPSILVALALCGALASSSCAHLPRGVGHGPLTADSITVGLWHMDEATGSDVADAGPIRLHGAAGIDTRAQFGRFGQGRHFSASVNSFVLVPANPSLYGTSGLTVEAWVYLEQYGGYLDTPIATCWAPEANSQSWMLTVTGTHDNFPPAVASGDHSTLMGTAPVGKLAFVYQPKAAGAPQAYFSARTIPLSRWAHVAATFDGQVVRLWVNGVLDVQYASAGSISESNASLMFGNELDPSALTRFGGYLRTDANVDGTPYFAFQGVIDEVRISSAARPLFPYGFEP